MTPRRWAKSSAREHLKIISTTSGTGSEVTLWAVITDPKRHIKYNVGGTGLIAAWVAILDPELTAGLPPLMTAATGMDALSHAIESIHARYYEPISDGLACQAIRLIVTYLPRCLEKGDDLEARGMQAIASTLAGMALICRRRGDMKLAVPFGPFLAVGAIAYLFIGAELWSWYIAVVR